MNDDMTVTTYPCTKHGEMLATNKAMKSELVWIRRLLIVLIAAVVGTGGGWI